MMAYNSLEILHVLEVNGNTIRLLHMYMYWGGGKWDSNEHPVIILMVGLFFVFCCCFCFHIDSCIIMQILKIGHIHYRLY